ncbi:MAG TPA: phage holin family protein [Casimicrobiaceae bacterium]|nr:phage holin family protein [Casimicrobiaceae bacterium]
MSVLEGGVGKFAARLSASVVSLLRTRIELASVEFAEERERLKASVGLIAVAAVAFGFAAIVATFGIIAWFWDSHRYEAIVVVALVYAVVGIAALMRQSALRRAAPAPFAASLDALRKDVEWLRSHRDGDPPAGS